MSLGKLKWAAIISFIVSMVLLIGGGIVARKDLPPYPLKVVGPEGNLLFGRSDIMMGQDVYQRHGLMDHGSVWGHGAQRGMEFSATTLHLLGTAVRSQLARMEYNMAYENLTGIQRDIIDLRTRRELKANRYNPHKDTLVLSPVQKMPSMRSIASGTRPSGKDTSNTAFFRIPSGLRKTAARSPDFFSGLPGWPRPSGRERITVTPITGPRTARRAMSPRRRSTYGPWAG